LATIYENEYFINIKNMEKILGVQLRHDEDRGRLYIERGATFADKQLNKVRPAWSPKGKLNLVWDYIPRFSPDLTKQATISGLDVISPTWFSIAADGRLLINNANMKYVQDAHAKGYKVWPLFKNGDFDPDLTKEFLANETMQDLIISQLLVYTALYNLDGINIDFEDIYEEDRERLTEFVKRLADALREQKVISSVDVTVPGSSPNWSKCYDRKGLAQAVDYVMVMTYDEHWGSSPVAGPVSSLGWVDHNLDLILKHYIPREKLVMGIPFYTREWRETIDEHGKVKVRSKAYGMDDIQKKLEEHNLKPIWLEDKGLFYTEYKKDSSLYRIWLEDEKSIAKKAALVKKYDLAGAASWRKGFEAPHIWPVLEKELKTQPTLSKK
jgi:spore germination protein YaaH